MRVVLIALGVGLVLVATVAAVAWVNGQECRPATSLDPFERNFAELTAGGWRLRPSPDGQSMNLCRPRLRGLLG